LLYQKISWKKQQQKNEIKANEAQKVNEMERRRRQTEKEMWCVMKAI
jgi:hypothetical protein